MASSRGLGVMMIAAIMVLVFCSSHVDAHPSDDLVMVKCGNHNEKWPSVPDGEPTCNNGECGIRCKDNFSFQNKKCVPNNELLPPPRD